MQLTILNVFFFIVILVLFFSSMLWALRNVTGEGPGNKKLTERELASEGWWWVDRWTRGLQGFSYLNNISTAASEIINNLTACNSGATWSLTEGQTDLRSTDRPDKGESCMFLNPSGISFPLIFFPGYFFFMFLNKLFMRLLQTVKLQTRSADYKTSDFPWAWGSKITRARTIYWLVLLSVNLDYSACCATDAG